MKNAVDREVASLLNDRLSSIEEHFNSDAIAFFGPLLRGVDDMFKQQIEDISESPKNHPKSERLLVILTTYGGSAEVVERIVNVMRHHYKEVNFLVPDYAYSAGTLFCMSGDNIYMNYYSVLGPIDPQVETKDGKLVPAQGYLDKVEEMINKSKTNELSDAEFLVLKGLDLAELRWFEQEKDLNEDLLKKWLVNYKFKNWVHKDTNKTATQDEKEARAIEIAKALGDTKVWHTHSRPISLIELRKIKLKIEDYSEDSSLKSMVDQYYDVLKDYVLKYGLPFFFHTRRHIT